MPDKKLFLLDGHALVYRAHYAFIQRPLINSKGLNTSAITGFVRTLWEMLSKQQPSHLAVSFDLSGPTFRHEMYEPYKANREAQPEDITTAFPYIRAIIEGFNIPIIEKAGYEADDVIGTIAKQAEKEGFKVYMVTPDKDYAQLVSENIFMYKPARMGNGVDILGVPEVLAKWQIQRVDQVIDVLGLQGDAVDNIPGIPGIGAKTAVKLLAQFDTMEGLLANTDQLKGKQREKVEAFAEQGLLSKKLATIDIEVPVIFDAEAAKVSDFNRDKLSELFKDLEFRSLGKSILGHGTQQIVQGDLFGGGGTVLSDAPVESSITADAHEIADKNITNTEHAYYLMDTPEKRADLIAILAKAKSICFDTETTGIDANEAELVGMSFAVKTGEAWYVPVPAEQDEAKAIVAEFKGVLEDATIEKVAQNIKYDMLILKWYGIEVKGPLFDTMIAHYLIEPELRHGMDYLAETYLQYQPIKITSLIGKKGKNQLTMRDIPVEKVVDYAAEDADITLQLKEFLEPKLKADGLYELYQTMEAPLVESLVELEYNGINLNAEELNEYSVQLGKEIVEFENSIYDKAGVRFNIASPKQVGQVLFEKLEIPYRWRKTKTGQFSTNEEKLSELAIDNPIVADILRFRGLAKLKSTYVDALPRMINPRTGRVHSSFNQALTATGRLSSNNPNLQNIPVRTPEGAKVREAFIPKGKDFVLLAADYSQIELRLIAEISGDEAMLAAFEAGQDIHKATAARIFGVEFDAVTKEHRYKAKTVNFSIIYGAGATNLSKQLGIKRSEASALIKEYFKQYQGLKTYMDTTIENARNNGYVTTLMGRRRYLRDINSRNGIVRSASERLAVNTPIQGTAADMIKIAMVNVHQALKAGNYKTKMILQVHDELVFDAHIDELDEVRLIIEEKMKTAIPNLRVPILVSMDTGANWLEAH